MKIAIPLAAGRLTAHFGHCEAFALLEVDTEAKAVTAEESAAPPPHQPGVLPAWLADQGVDVVLAGGMGGMARQVLTDRGVEVIVGLPSLEPRPLAEGWLRGEIGPGANACDH